jgi:molecular chaperone GrpE (heat shock protein)
MIEDDMFVAIRRLEREITVQSQKIDTLTAEVLNLRRSLPQDRSAFVRSMRNNSTASLVVDNLEEGKSTPQKDRCQYIIV